MGNGISHLYLFRSLDTGNDIAYISRAKFIPGNQFHFQHPHLIGVILLAGIEKLHFVTFTDHSVLNLEISDNSTERVEYRVENQSL